MIPSDIARDPTGSPQTDPVATWTVIYDADCGFCRWSLARVLDLDADRRLRPLALETAEADQLLSDLTPQQRNASWHLISPDGRRTSAGAAVAPLARLLKGTGPLAPVLERVPALPEHGYRWVAEHRGWFGRLIPDSAKRRADEAIRQREATSAPGLFDDKYSSSASGASVSS